MAGERDPAAVVPASRFPHGYASVRSLSRAGVRTIAAVADEALPIAASRYPDEVVSVPPSNDLLAYRDALLELAARPDVATIVPHRPQGPYVLAKYREAFEEYVDLAVPDLATLRRVHDRKRLMEAAAEAGVPAPETRLLAEGASWDVDRVVKARYNVLASEYVEDFAPADSAIAKSVTHVPAGETADFDALRAKLGHEPIVQAYVDGADEYVFGALYDRGEAVATFQHRQLREGSYTGSGGVYRETVEIPELDRVGRRLLDHLEWHGLACIEYVADAETGAFVPVEINPRLWQSLACATRAGAAFPYWYWLLATGRGDAIDPGYEPGVRTHYLYGELEHLVSLRRADSALVERPSLPATLASIGWSWLRDPAFDYLHLDDPGPAAHQVRVELGAALDRRLG